MWVYWVPLVDRRRKQDEEDEYGMDLLVGLQRGVGEKIEEGWRQGKKRGVKIFRVLNRG